MSAPAGLRQTSNQPFLTNMNEEKYSSAVRKSWTSGFLWSQGGSELLGCPVRWCHKCVWAWRSPTECSQELHATSVQLHVLTYSMFTGILEIKI